MDKFILQSEKIDYLSIFKLWDQKLSSAKSFRRKSDFNDPEKRVDLLEKHFTWSALPADRLTNYSKSTATATKLRKEGNTFFEMKQWRDALRHYNLAILFAPECDEQLALAYGNRSAVLVRMDYPEEALRDVELALASNYPDTKKSKLEQRRIKCQKMIDGEGYDEFETHAMGEAKAELIQFQKFREEMLRIESPNPKMPSAADFVEVKFDDERGRYLVSNKDLGPGTVVIVEKPVVKTLVNETEWDVDHCHYCMKRINRGIPCKSCVFALYCDEDCRSKAYDEFHRFECKIMPYIHIGSLHQPTVLALRLITQMGPAELLHLSESRDPKYFKPCENTREFGTDPDCDYESNPYTAVYHHLTHSDKLCRLDKFWHTYQALLLTTMLEKCTLFFGDVPPEKGKKFKSFVAALMTHHIESFQVNSSAILELHGFEDIPLKEWFRLNDVTLDIRLKLTRKRERLPIGAGMYPVYSLMNHSCDPNTFRLYDVQNGTLLAVTHRSVKAGEEITACYTDCFYVTPTYTRAVQLMDRSFFTCDCLPCKYNYPSLNELGTKFAMCCAACSQRFMEKDKMSKDFLRCHLPPGDKKCGRCGTQYEKEKLLEELNDNNNVSCRGEKLIKLGKLREAIEFLQVPMEYYRLNLVPPYGRKYCNELLYMNAMCTLFHYSQ